MDLGQLIKQPEMMDKETLYDLRSLVALYPYYQTARLLMLQNLYVLHSQSFDEELRKASVYFTDRRVVFKLVEAAHYKLRNAEEKTQKNTIQRKARAVRYRSSTNSSTPCPTMATRRTTRRHDASPLRQTLQ